MLIILTDYGRKIQNGRYGNKKLLMAKWVEKEDIEYIHKKATNELNILSGNKLLLVGAGGFLGFYFIKAILAWNDKSDKKIHLTALSSFRDGIPSWIASFKKRTDFKILKKDITSFDVSKDLVFDYIIHAASIASPTFYRKYPIETINANVQGLYKILDYLLARKSAEKPVKGLLYFSSSEIYGDPTEGNIPTPEDYKGNVSCTGPRACYDESKRFCETLCVNYSRVHNLPIKTARPFNNYGPGMKITDGRVIVDFSKNIIENKDIVMFSSGTPSRTFCYVADAIVGYLKILTKGKAGEAYNIGVENPEISVVELAKKMIKIAEEKFDYRGKLSIKESNDEEYLTDNPQRRCPITVKARKELGYKPEIKLDEGLYRTLSLKHYFHQPSQLSLLILHTHRCWQLLLLLLLGAERAYRVLYLEAGELLLVLVSLLFFLHWVT